MSETQTPSAPSRLCACRLAFVIGIVWGAALLLLGIATLYTQTYGHKFLDLFGSIYPGVEAASWKGALLGGVWGFADGFVGTLIIVGLYNLLARCGACCTSKAKPGTPDESKAAD